MQKETYCKIDFIFSQINVLFILQIFFFFFFALYCKK